MMRGSIVEKESDATGETSYRVFFDIPEHSRDNLEESERPRITETFKTEEEAEEFLLKLNHKYCVQNEQVPSSKTLAKHFESWLETKQEEIKASTISNYRKLAETHITPSLGSLSLEEINAQRVQQFLNQKKEEGYSGSYRHDMYVVLKGALDLAVNLGLISTNPLHSVNAPSQTPERNKEMTILDEKQIRKLIETVTNEEPWFETYYHLVCNTGLRRGESLGLRWEDVDFEDNSIYINQQLTVKNELGLILDTPKSENSRRKIHLFPPVMKRLEEYYSEQEKMKDKIGEEQFYGHDRLQEVDLSEEQLVFTDPDGKPIRPGRMTKHIKRMCRAADLPEVTFHSLRHSHVSLLIKMGVDVKTISKRLGHSSVELTLDKYGHLFPGQDREAADTFGKLIYEEETQDTGGNNSNVSQNVTKMG